MHIADQAGGNLGATGIVASGIPTAVGIALALQMRHSTQVLLCFMGEGATNLGEFHESLNLASVWKLPVVFVVDNNQYSMSMNVRNAMNIEQVSVRAGAYGIPELFRSSIREARLVGNPGCFAVAMILGLAPAVKAGIPGETVDGNDVLAVYRAVKPAVERARSGQGPALIDNLTYRWRGHSKSDRNLYRTADEIEYWKKLCPIDRFKRVLIENRVMSPEEVAEYENQAKGAIERAAEEGLSYPDPTPENLENEVYAP